MDVFTKIYQLCLKRSGSRSGKFSRRAASMVRNLILRFADPVCEMHVHGHKLGVPLSHPLPLYHATYPQCDSVLGRLAGWIRETGKPLVYIDIGANIGDTIAAINPMKGDRVFAIEPHPPYAKLLRKNTARLKCKTQIIEKACVENLTDAGLSIDGKLGTGVLVEDGEGSLPSTTLDLIVAEFPEMESCDLLKVDVDGYDFSVLRGGDRFLSKSKPIVLLESDVFENSNYMEDVVSLVNRMKGYGYRHLLVYDNYGGLLTALPTENISSLIPILFYQVTRNTIYLDLLFGTDLLEFGKREMEYFADLGKGNTRREVAKTISTKVNL